jgi:hypothetical protein
MPGTQQKVQVRVTARLIKKRSVNSRPVHGTRLAPCTGGPTVTAWDRQAGMCGLACSDSDNQQVSNHPRLAKVHWQAARSPPRRPPWPGLRRAKTDNDDRLIGMSSEPLPPPKLATLASVLPDYGKFPFDRTFEATRNDIGGQPDLANPEHAKQLRIWLNQWLCRIGYPGLRDEVFADSLASWWPSFKDKLARRAARKASDG